MPIYSRYFYIINANKLIALSPISHMERPSRKDYYNKAVSNELMVVIFITHLINRIYLSC